MNATITLEDKKVFINWLLKNQKFKRREPVWILNYLLTHENILKHVHFIEEAHHCDRSMVISATGTESIPFRFYKGNLISSDAEKAFTDIRINPEKDMYIQINFENKFTQKEFLDVLEENHKTNSSNNDDVINVSEETEKLIADIVANSGRLTLMNEIDKALDNGDKELFMKLSGMLNEKKDVESIEFNLF